MISEFAAPFIDFYLLGAGRIPSFAIGVYNNIAKKNIDKLQEEVIQALNNSKKRYLVVIDDIDRLSPKEILLILQLVKSMGHLPNIMYLLNYDRKIVEQAIRNEYKLDAPHYLEKIVQLPFPVPPPSVPLLRGYIINTLLEIWGKSNIFTSKNFMRNFRYVLNRVVMPEIKLPRDASRIINSYRNYWKDLEHEIDPLDLLCIETWKIKRPYLYSVITSSKSELTEYDPDYHKDPSKFINLLLAGLKSDDKERIQFALNDLFPRLENPNQSSTLENKRFRKICSNEHFDTYFRYKLSDDAISIKIINELLKNCDNEQYILGVFLQMMKEPNNYGGTRLSEIFRVLTAHYKDISLKKIEGLLIILAKNHDKLDIEEDDGMLSRGDSNSHQIRWLTIKLICRRHESVHENEVLFMKSKLALKIASKADIGWLHALLYHVESSHKLIKSENIVRESDYITTEDDAKRMQTMTLKKIEKSANDGSLLYTRNLIGVLMRWENLLERSGDDKGKVAIWCREQLKNIDSVIAIAHRFVAPVKGGDKPYNSYHKITNNLFGDQVFIKRVKDIMEEIGEEAVGYSSLKRFSLAWEEDVYS